MNEAIQLYVRNPVHVAYFFVTRDNSICFHEWIRFRTRANWRGRLPQAGQARSAALSRKLRAARGPRGVARLRRARSGASYIAKPPRGPGGQGISVTTTSTRSPTARTLSSSATSSGPSRRWAQGARELYGPSTSVASRAYL